MAAQLSPSRWLSRYWISGIPICALLVLQLVFELWMRFIYQEAGIVRGSLRAEWLKGDVQLAPLAEFVTRYSRIGLWGLSYYAFVVIGILALGLSLWDIHYYVRALPRIKRRSIYCVLTLLVVLPHLAGSATLLATSQTIVDAIEDQASFESLGVCLHHANGVMFSATLTVAVCVGLHIAQRPDSPAASQALAWRMSCARRLLYVASLYFVAGTFQLRMWMEWPTIWLDEQAAASIRQLATTAVSISGAKGALFLLAIFLPSHVALGRNAARLAESEIPDGTTARRKEWIAAEGLVFDVRNGIASVLAIVAPVFANTLFDGLLTAFRY